MEILNILFIAFAVAMDSFAVSLSCGLAYKHHPFRPALAAGISFGLFQGIMPIIGWFIGLSFRAYIIPFDHWIAFVLLSIIGFSMINDNSYDCDKHIDLCNFKVLITLSIATSIDALATGVSLSVLDIDILKPAILITLITSITSFFGVYLGHRINSHKRIQHQVDIIGGIFLLIIGFKILIEHLFFGC